MSNHNCRTRNEAMAGTVEAYLRTGAGRACLLLSVLALCLHAAEVPTEPQVEPNPNPPGGLVLLTDYCDNLTFDAALPQTMEQGCYIDVTYKHEWSANPSANPYDLPHGVLLQITSSATVVGATSTSGPWFTSSPAATRTITTDKKTVYWNKPPAGSTYPAGAANAIPSLQELKFRVFVDNPGSATITVVLRELTGWSWPNDPNKWSCQSPKSLTKPLKTYKLSINCPTVPGRPNCYQLGAGQWTTIKALTTSGANPPQYSVVKWYKRLASGPCACDAFSLANANTWDPHGKPEQTTRVSSEASYTTNGLTQSYCYAAIVEEGCFAYATDPIQVNICPATGAVGDLTPTPAPSTLDGAYHACSSFGLSKISLSNPGTCFYTIKWTRTTNGGSLVDLGTYSGSSEFTFPPPYQQYRNLTYLGSGCNTKYTFNALITYQFCNQQQQVNKSLTIVIDRPTQPGKITANPWDMCGSPCPVVCNDENPVLCWNRATHLTYSEPCNRVLSWDSSLNHTDWYPMTWVGAGSEDFNTNTLPSLHAPNTKTVWYRAKVQNGVCDEKYKEIKVTIKPQLVATISGNTVICLPGGSTTLTASTSYDPYGYAKEYQWWFGGNFINGAINKTYNATNPGNYYVVVKDKTCEAETTSNVLTVCAPAISISGPATVCKLGPNQPSCKFTLTASSNGCAPCGTYIWTKPDGTNPTGPSITDQLPPGVPHGTYNVKNVCGGCEVKASFTVRVCP